VSPVADLRDLQVLIPQVRRAIDGPHAMSSASVSSTLNDGEVLALAADATADVILMTGGAASFGYKLIATERDSNYLAPIAWETDTERTVEADRVVVAQSALNFFFHKFRDLKIKEDIADEGESWTYELSGPLIRDQLRLLQAARDKALEMIALEHHALDTYVSFVAERDLLTARFVEPWVGEVGGQSPSPGYGLGEGGFGGWEVDPTYGTWW
jgi:hypothetical protein